MTDIGPDAGGDAGPDLGAASVTSLPTFGPGLPGQSVTQSATDNGDIINPAKDDWIILHVGDLCNLTIVQPGFVTTGLSKIVVKWKSRWTPDLFSVGGEAALTTDATPTMTLTGYTVPGLGRYVVRFLLTTDDDTSPATSKGVYVQVI